MGRESVPSMVSGVCLGFFSSAVVADSSLLKTLKTFTLRKHSVFILEQFIL